MDASHLFDDSFFGSVTLALDVKERLRTQEINAREERNFEKSSRIFQRGKEICEKNTTWERWRIGRTLHTIWERSPRLEKSLALERDRIKSLQKVLLARTNHNKSMDESSQACTGEIYTNGWQTTPKQWNLTKRREPPLNTDSSFRRHFHKQAEFVTRSEHVIRSLARLTCQQERRKREHAKFKEQLTELCRPLIDQARMTLQGRPHFDAGLYLAELENYLRYREDGGVNGHNRMLVSCDDCMEENSSLTSSTGKNGSLLSNGDVHRKNGGLLSNGDVKVKNNSLMSNENGIGKCSDQMSNSVPVTEDHNNIAIPCNNFHHAGKRHGNLFPTLLVPSVEGSSTGHCSNERVGCNKNVSADDWSINFNKSTLTVCDDTDMVKGATPEYAEGIAKLPYGVGNALLQDGQNCGTVKMPIGNTLTGSHRKLTDEPAIKADNFISSDFTKASDACQMPIKRTNASNNFRMAVFSNRKSSIINNSKHLRDSISKRSHKPTLSDNKENEMTKNSQRTFNNARNITQRDNTMNNKYGSDEAFSNFTFTRNTNKFGNSFINNTTIYSGIPIVNENSETPYVFKESGTSCGMNEINSVVSKINKETALIPKVKPTATVNHETEVLDQSSSSDDNTIHTEQKYTPGYLPHINHSETFCNIKANRYCNPGKNRKAQFSLSTSVSEVILEEEEESCARSESRLQDGNHDHDNNKTDQTDVKERPESSSKDYIMSSAQGLPQLWRQIERLRKKPRSELSTTALTRRHMRKSNSRKML